MKLSGHGRLIFRFASVAAIVAASAGLGIAQDAEFGWIAPDPVGEGEWGFPPMFKVALEDQDSGKYWLGVVCHEASPELRSQLGLDDREGIVVVRVAPDSPAAKSGLKEHDVLVAVADSKLGRVADLTKAVDAADGKEIVLKLIRKGEQQSVTVTPKPRSQDEIKKDVVKVVRPRAGFFRIEEEDEDVVTARLPGPKGPPLPDNVKVTIVREGKQPATITVRRKGGKSGEKRESEASEEGSAKDEKWELNENELDKLPNDLRRLVEPMLRPMPHMIGIRGEVMPATPGRRIVIEHRGAGQKFTMPLPPPGALPGGETHSVPAVPGTPVAPPGAGHGHGDPMAHVLKRLEMLDRRLEVLQDELQHLRGEGPRHPGGRQPKGPPHGEGEHP